MRIKAIQTKGTEHKEAKVKGINRRKKKAMKRQKVIKSEEHYNRKEIRNFYKEATKGKKDIPNQNALIIDK